MQAKKQSTKLEGDGLLLVKIMVQSVFQIQKSIAQERK